MYPGLYFDGFWARWVLVGLETARSNLDQTSVNLGQTLGNVSRTFFMGVFDVARLRRVMLARLSCPVLRADTRENPVGKNGVMTLVDASHPKNSPKTPQRKTPNPYFMPNYALTALGLEQKLC